MYNNLFELLEKTSSMQSQIPIGKRVKFNRISKMFYRTKSGHLENNCCRQVFQEFSENTCQ